MSRQVITVRNFASILRLGVAIGVVAALVAAGVVLTREPERHHLSAYFDRAVGLYPGADVRILGIPVGKVTEVTPKGDSVLVEMTYEARRKVPAGAKAMIVSQTLVSDRFVQLAPVYKGGPTLRDGVTLGTDRTEVPVEVDQVGGSLNDLSKALGPQGANRDQSLSRLLQVGADTLQGQGDDLRQTIADTSRMLSTLSEDRGDVAATIKNLKVITDAMVASDRQIRQFNEHLAGVSGQLAGEKEELSAALNTLGPTLRNVQRFIKDNRGGLSTNVRQLAQVTGVLVKQRKAFTEFLEQGPLFINNLARAYDPISGTIGTRANLSVNFSNLADWICSLTYSVGTPAKQCLNFLGPVNGLGKALSHLSLDLSWITALTTHYDPEPIPPDAYGPNDPRNPRTGGQGVTGGGRQNPDGDTQRRGGDFRSLLPGGGR
ncbi:MCE family protein [Thermomonospora umbrina]|uniref:Phospholipid/cholesterol/gamma-HCH transport system substrate-binding protein n=1 Tax=Thermomonospora umbrina TaxID=111806 RepID=A0A3D9SR50_9ACTN|nr:MCE family protein [Thermomonospora umbrina]REE98107.1 phospholipid/cholesterol/gamma-HCH transport system substrate-binding protein [Thermomonospora umbrina]